MKNTMKTSITIVLAAVIALGLASCDAQYKKTSSGLVYKIIRGNSKDSLARSGDVVKHSYVLMLNDSVMFDTHGKMPYYSQVSDRAKGSYSYYEILSQLKNGDSAIAIQLVDTLFKKGFQKQLQQQIPTAKKGDRLKVYMKVLEVFRNDSTGRADYNAELAKDAPRREKEEREAMTKIKAKEEKEMQDYFAAKKIKPTQKAPLGTYAVINEKGNGEPVVKAKFVTVKYDGRFMKNDEQFDAGVYTFQIQVGNAIMGWHDGLTLFNQGGKGVLYVPGSLAYGEEGRGPIGPNEPLKFDVEILNVNDTEAKAMVADSIARKQIVK
jgi:FKBP-type peptidyl-prolyl cis-trans isomerase